MPRFLRHSEAAAIASFLCKSEVLYSRFLCTYYYEINNQKAPFTDVRVRTALKLGLDRDIIANKVKGQGDLPAYGYTPPYTERYSRLRPAVFSLLRCVFPATR